MRKLALRCSTALVLVVVIGNLRGENATGARAVEDFRLEGVAIWQCQCPAYGCPCQKNGLPTHGMCHASDFAHIKKGRYGKVSLDGLNVVMVGKSRMMCMASGLATKRVCHGTSHPFHASQIELWCLLSSYCTQGSVLLIYLGGRESNSRADIGAKNPNG